LLGAQRSGRTNAATGALLKNKDTEVLRSPVVILVGCKIKDDQFWNKDNYVILKKERIYFRTLSGENVL
jgi:hypothetical protein